MLNTDEWQHFAEVVQLLLTMQLPDINRAEVRLWMIIGNKFSQIGEKQQAYEIAQHILTM